MKLTDLMNIPIVDADKVITDIYSVPTAVVSGLLQTKSPTKTKVIVFWQDVMPFSVLNGTGGTVWRGNDGLARWKTKDGLIEGAFLHVADIETAPELTNLRGLRSFTEDDAYKIAQFLLEDPDFLDFIFACEDGRGRSAAAADAFFEVITQLKPQRLIKRWMLLRSHPNRRVYTLLKDALTEVARLQGLFRKQSTSQEKIPEIID